MKIALIITDGVEQIVLTPDNKTEQKLIERITNEKVMKVSNAAFYETTGDFYRFGSREEEPNSTIITLSHPPLQQSKITCACGAELTPNVRHDCPDLKVGVKVGLLKLPKQKKLNQNKEYA